MKKNYTAKVFITLLFGALASTFAVYASTPMKNFPINKNPLYGGMYVVAASTFSIEDAESSTELSTFPMSDVVVYPNSATLTMDAAYTEKSSNFGTGGTAAAPNYAVTNVASNITTSFNFGTSDKNYLYFHAPKSQGKVLAISTEHKANTDVYFKTTISLVAGSKTKLELWMGPAGETVKVADYEFNKGGQKTQWDISEYLYENSAAVSGSTIVFEIRRANYNEGDDCVFAMGEFYVYSTLDMLKISGSQLSAPYGTPITLTASYKNPLTQQNLYWYQGKTIGGYPSYDMISQYTGQNPIEVIPPIGKFYYTVTALDPDDLEIIAKTDTLEVERYLECSGNSKVLWYENFGTLASEDARNSYEGMTYAYAATDNVKDGMYAITANPRTCGQDNDPAREEADYWFRSIYDHTQGGAKGGSYGGMLLVNCRDAQSQSAPTHGIPAGSSDIVLRKRISADEIGCQNSKIWINFSAWFANADWNRGRGDTHPIKMDLRVIAIDEVNGNKVIGSIEVVAGVEDGWKRGVVSIPYTGGDLALQIMNHGESGGGNDVLIDDIQFEVCRPTVELAAETLDGTRYEDIKNVRTQKCGDKVKLVADPANAYSDIYPTAQSQCPYFVWQESKDGETWSYVYVDGEPWEGFGKCEGSAVDYSIYAPATIENQPMYYRAVIGHNSREITAYLANPVGNFCYSVVETPSAYVYCSSLKMTIEKEKCNEYEVEVENAEEGHTYKWEYGNDNCGWTVIDGQTGKEIKFDAKAYLDLLNKKSAASADEGECCELGIKVTDNQSGDMAVGYINTVYLPSLTAELLSQENCNSKYRLVADITDACYGEPVGEMYEFYKDGKKINRCEEEDNNNFNGSFDYSENNNTFQIPTRGSRIDPTYDGGDVADCDWDPEYITEDLLGGATYTVKFAGYDDLMFCEATVNLTAGCDIMWPTIITPFTEDKLNDVFAPFYCAEKSSDGKCNKSVEFPAENIVSIKVFDRSGNMVAETAKAGWDGKSSSKMVMPGVYYYVAVCIIDGQEQSFRGTVEVFNELNTSKK